MTRTLFVAFAALCAVSLGAPPASALRPTDGIGGVGVPDVLDPCTVDPGLCEPPPPPPDPCEIDPDLCDPPPPPDPCDVAPELCGGEPPVADPGDPVPALPQHVALAGTARLVADGFRTREPFSLALDFDESSFRAVDGDGNVYTGALVPKQAKAKLFLDDGSTDVLAGDVASRALAASGRPGTTLAGKNAKLTLRIRDDGSASLKLKVEVFLSGIGEVTFKANLTGPLAQPLAE
jgi:hypothetical protein